MTQMTAYRQREQLVSVNKCDTTAECNLHKDKKETNKKKSNRFRVFQQIIKRAIFDIFLLFYFCRFPLFDFFFGHNNIVSVSAWLFCFREFINSQICISHMRIWIRSDTKLRIRYFRQIPLAQKFVTWYGYLCFFHI